MDLEIYVHYRRHFLSLWDKTMNQMNMVIALVMYGLTQ